ncbi:MAG TPA: hypothetical protein VNA68_03500 [Candidatus Dormibacteraeota bacterium]|nr:hypothetical protein [Candidatus Dormibacteraeota bacterium]
MDSSTSHHSIALRHAMEGVPVDELTPSERITILKEKVSIFTNWRGKSPGFAPYGFRWKDCSTKCARGINTKTKVLEICVVRASTPKQPVEIILLTLDGRFIIETFTSWVEDGEVRRHIEARFCTNEELEAFEERLYLLNSVNEVMRSAIERSKESHRRDLISLEMLERSMLRTW